MSGSGSAAVWQNWTGWGYREAAFPMPPPPVWYSVAPLPPPRVTNLDRFIEAVTPSVQAQLSDEGNIRKCRGKEPELRSFYRLNDLWDSFAEWSVYGVGVPLVLKGEELVVQYYVPFLSGLQLYVDPVKIPSRSRCRYPIYRIPVGLTLKDLSASFLTFHSLSPTSKDNGQPWSLGVDDVPKMSLPVFGLAHYRLHGSILSPCGPHECEQETSLLRAADSWLRNLQAIHPDYEHFTKNYSQWR